MSMTHEQLLDEIKQLLPEEKKALLDEIFRIVREESRPSAPSAFAGQLREIDKPEFVARDEFQNSQKLSLSLSQRLYGILKFNGDPPNDEEVKDLIADYLVRKYS
jgi:hypothetical protein